MEIDRSKLTSELQEKLNKLEDNIRELGSVAIGFSGGVDSSFLLAVAHNVLGENVIAVTGADASVPERELKEAIQFCSERNTQHVICKVDPLKEEGYPGIPYAGIRGKLLVKVYRELCCLCS